MKRFLPNRSSLAMFLSLLFFVKIPVNSHAQAYNACGTIQMITCGQTNSANISPGPGQFDYYPNFGGLLPDGKELIYQFTPTQTGKYVLSATNTNFNPAAYFIKQASLGCDRYSWQNLTTVYGAPSSTVIGTLTAGVAYYLMLDAQASVGTQQDFMIECASVFDPCTSISTVTCAAPTIVNIPSGPGAYDILNEDGFSTNAGKEKIFSYTAVTTGRIQVSLSADQSYNGAGVFIKNANNGCNGTNWTSLGVANLYYGAWGSNGFNVTAGNTYYIMVDASSLDGSSLTMNILCPTVWEPCTAITSVSCGQSIVAVIPAGVGKFDTTGAYCSFSNHPGKELIYSFSPSQTGYYSISVSTSEFKEVNYMFKEAGNCDANGWQCLGYLSFSSNLYTPKLFAGTTYYLMVDAKETSGVTTQTFTINCNIAPDPCLSIAALDCGGNIDISLLAGRGAFFPSNLIFSGSGTEKIIGFTAATTGTYFLKTNSHTGGTIFFAIKKASDGCSENNWKYIEQVSNNKTILIPEQLIAGTDYYLLAENAYSFSDATDNIEIICPTESYDPCATLSSISGCGVSITSTHQPGVGSFVPYSFAGGYAYFGSGIGGPAGKENLYQFTPTVSGRYIINSTAGTGEVSFLIKEASGGCTSSGWSYIGNAGPSAGFYPWPIPIELIAGTTYYILVDADDITGASNTFELICPETYNPCDNISQLGCGSELKTVTTIAGLGNFFKPFCSGVSQPVGKEMIYQFTAQENGYYIVQGTAPGITIGVYLKKSSLGCNETGWLCIGELSGIFPQTITTSTVSKGEKYMIMFVPLLDYGGFGSFSFSLFCNVSCTIYADADNDGYGDPSKAFSECYTVPFGYSANKQDCNDANSNVNPSATEICGNNIDDNCNGQVDEGCNLPIITINNTTVTEGNNGTQNATFKVSLSKRSDKTITVQYQTAINTAVSPEDYVDKSGTLSFSPNALNQTITVQVNGDKLNEANEKFMVQLSNAVNAIINVGTGTCTINNDDPVPNIRLNDATSTESSQLATLKVDLSEASAQIVRVKYDTKDGTAKAPGDYTAVSNGQVEFQPGDVTKNITIVIKQDGLNEGTEKFVVKLKQPENGNIARGEAEVRITNSGPVLTKNAPSAITDEENIVVSPNPANTQIHIHSYGKLSVGKVQLQLIDQSGRLVRQWESSFITAGQLMTLPVADIAGGMYLLIINNGRGKLLHQKVVIEH